MDYPLPSDRPPPMRRVPVVATHMRGRPRARLLRSSPDTHDKDDIPSAWHSLEDPHYRRWLVRACLYEFFGTFILIYIQAASGETLLRLGTPAFVNDALGHGLAAFIAVYITFHVSGAIFNPALALGLWLTRRFDALTVLLYSVMHVGASIAAAGVLRASLQSLTQGLGVPRLVNGISVAQGLLMTSVLGVALIWMFSMAYLRGRYFYYRNHYRVHGNSPTYPAHAALVAFGWNAGVEAAFVNSIGSGPNPVRWLGPAIITGRLQHWAVWIAGPFIGVLIGAALYGIDVALLRPDRSRIDTTQVREADAKQRWRQGTKTPLAPEPPFSIPILQEL